MKKLFAGVLLFFVLCGSLVIWKKVSDNAPVSEVALISPEVLTVNETASCEGYLRAEETENLRIGVAAEIISVFVSEGDAVSAGDPLFEYRKLGSEEISLVWGELVSEEVSAFAEDVISETDSGDILDAAEFYAANGRIPDWFKDFYVSDTISGASAGTGETVRVKAGIDGTVLSVDIEAGELKSGLLPVMTVSSTNRLVAEVGIQQEYLAEVECGQYANVKCTAYGSAMFAANVISVADEARTVGGLLTAESTVVDAILEFKNSDERLMPGLAVRADIFINVWEDAVVVPYTALCSDGDREFVWVWKDGAVSAVYISPVYKYSKGVVTRGELEPDVLLVNEPDEGLFDGMAVSVVSGE